ncbi:hypothetical protein [Halanaeroarchaeum sulfurireducens]|uniref:Uncharacterized protein n=1 Tax=Halanaeroarchaeum sulfurireducens TaxID=1604004 RepID=A0A0F7P623_9EURY|nr:hypothetical protein [Halanaeroarchaeum sulfurireducens]AKH96626.1 hypothetical protein HLASF_0112 [Halanaeroarchaeum sulfurireducens]ALG81028.1 hypothetical protein HLASA_0112 [Halanaeroarchaeum sulfurireducens]
MSPNDGAESCGRCAMTTAVDVTDGHGTNPWESDRIEVDEAELRAASRHVIALAHLVRRLNEWMLALTYGRTVEQDLHSSAK